MKLGTVAAEVTLTAGLAGWGGTPIPLGFADTASARASSNTVQDRPAEELCDVRADGERRAQQRPGVAAGGLPTSRTAAGRECAVVARMRTGVAERSGAPVQLSPSGGHRPVYCHAPGHLSGQGPSGKSRSSRAVRLRPPSATSPRWCMFLK